MDLRGSTKGSIRVSAPPSVGVLDPLSQPQKGFPPPPLTGIDLSTTIPSFPSPIQCLDPACLFHALVDPYSMPLVHLIGFLFRSGCPLPLPSFLVSFPVLTPSFPVSFPVFPQNESAFILQYGRGNSEPRLSESFSQSRAATKTSSTRCRHGSTLV